MWVWVSGFTNHIVLNELITLIKQRGLTRFLEGNPGLKTVQTRMACCVSLVYFSSSTLQNGTTMAYKKNFTKTLLSFKNWIYIHCDDDESHLKYTPHFQILANNKSRT